MYSLLWSTLFASELECSSSCVSRLKFFIFSTYFRITELNWHLTLHSLLVIRRYGYICTSKALKFEANSPYWCALYKRVLQKGPYKISLFIMLPFVFSAFTINICVFQSLTLLVRGRLSPPSYPMFLGFLAALHSYTIDIWHEIARAQNGLVSQISSPISNLITSGSLYITVFLQSIANL